MPRKRDWLLIPGLLMGLGLTIMSCSQSDGTSTSQSGQSTPPQSAMPSKPPAQSAPGSSATAPSPPGSGGSSATAPAPPGSGSSSGG